MPTYQALATVTVPGGGTSTIVISNISQAYTDLLILASLRSGRPDAPYGNCRILLNGVSSGSTYSSRTLRAVGTSVGSFATSTTIEFGTSTAFSTSGAFGSACFYIPNYTSGGSKTVLIDSVMETNSADGFPYLTGGLFASSSPITSINLVDADASSFAQYSTVTVYGIKNS